jgi:hypothetical protein
MSKVTISAKIDTWDANAFASVIELYYGDQYDNGDSQLSGLFISDGIIQLLEKLASSVGDLLFERDPHEIERMIKAIDHLHKHIHAEREG